MKTLTLYIIGALLMAARPAFGRIGENEQQIEERYGKPLIRDNKDFDGHRLVLFRINGMDIGVAFSGGKSAAEFYSKEDRSYFSANEIQLLLAANSAGGNWTKSESVPMWKLQPAEYTAALTENGRRFTIAIKDFFASSSAARENEEKEKLKGF
jgi:hypothetical protein